MRRIGSGFSLFAMLIVAACAQTPRSETPAVSDAQDVPRFVSVIPSMGDNGLTSGETSQATLYPRVDFMAGRPGAASVACKWVPTGFETAADSLTLYVLRGCHVTALTGDPEFGAAALQMVTDMMLDAKTRPPVWTHDYTFTPPAGRNVSWGTVQQADGAPLPPLPHVILPAVPGWMQSPLYPDDMLDVERPGYASVRCAVDASGTPAECVPLEGTNGSFKQAALDKALLDKYRPALLDGRPTGQHGRITLVNFILNGSAPFKPPPGPEDAVNWSFDGIDLAPPAQVLDLTCRLAPDGETTGCDAVGKNTDAAFAARGTAFAKGLRYPWLKAGGALRPQTSVTVILDYGPP